MPLRLRHAAMTAFALSALPAAASAQAADSTLAAAVAVAPAPAAVPADAPRGPTLDAARAGATRVRAETEAVRAEAERQPRRGGGFGQSQTLMIVGGAALLLGLVIGDSAGNLLAVGGAVVGLVGLYQYLR